jgi:hypothetical protein
MSDSQNEGRRIDPSESQELSEEALETVAGGCQQGCSNESTCGELNSLIKWPESPFPGTPIDPYVS